MKMTVWFVVPPPVPPLWFSLSILAAVAVVVAVARSP